MNNPFPVRLRAASIVPRWSIVHTQKPDYVAGHSFYVGLYAARIAVLINWRPDDPASGFALLWAALVHDLDELTTGDVVGPVKSNIVDPVKLSNFIGRKMDQMMPGWPQGHSLEPGIRLIVKAADQLDALFFTLGEQALGNQIIAARIPSAYDKLREAWFKLPINNTEGFLTVVDPDSQMPDTPRVPKQLANLWLDVVVPAINEHRDPKRYDIE